MAELTDRITRLGPRTVRALALGGVLAVVAVVSGLLAAFGVDTVEIVATLLVVPVFGLALYLGQGPGFAAGAVAVAVYAVLRRPDLDSTGLPSFAVLVLARALAYGVVVYAGTWVRHAVAAGAGDDRGQLGLIGAADDRGLRAEPTAARNPVFVFDQAGAAEPVPVGVGATAVHGASPGPGPGGGWGPDDRATGGPGGWGDDEPHPSEWRVGPSALPPDDPEARPWTGSTALGDGSGVRPDGRPVHGSAADRDGGGPRTGAGFEAAGLGADVWDEPLGGPPRPAPGPPTPGLPPPHGDRRALPAAGPTHEGPVPGERDRRQANHDDFWGTRPGDDEGWGGAPTTRGRDPWGAPRSGRVPAATGSGPGVPDAPPVAGGDDPWGPPSGPPSGPQPTLGSGGPQFYAHSGERPVPGPPGAPGAPGGPAGPAAAPKWGPPTGDPARQGAPGPTATPPGPWEQIRPPERWDDPPPQLDPRLPPPGAPPGRGGPVSGRTTAVGGAAAGAATGRGAPAMPAVDPETRLWSARYLCDRLAAEQRQAAGGHPFSLVLVQVPDGPLAALSYRRQVTLLRELGHQFVAGGIVDHLVHVPDQAQHWFAVVLPDTDKSGAEAFENRLRSGIGGYLRSRGLLLGDLDSASLTSPDDDAAMGAIWEALIASGDPSSSPELAFDS